MILPKYVRIRRNKYHYQRDYPIRLQHHAGKKTFTRPMNLFVNNATQLELSKAVVKMEEEFNIEKNLLTNSDPDAFNATELDIAATNLLRRKGFVSGDLKDIDFGSEIAEQILPEIDDLRHKRDPLSAQEKVIETAYWKLLEKEKARPKTLTDLWKEYIEFRGIDPLSRNGKKAVKYWRRWISLSGETSITKNAIDHINDGLDRYVEERTGKVSSSTLKRELSDITSCLRLASKRHRLGWLIELPVIKHTPPRIRYPLDPDKQLKLVQAILSPESKIKPYHGAVLLLCLQGGMMVSEIKRIKSDDLGLNAELPHIVVRNETKKDSRKRIIPIVIGLDLIKASIHDSISWIKHRTESGPSGTLKKIMRRIIIDDLTSPHCLRHTFKANAHSAGVSVLTIASIAGWTDSQRNISKHLLYYGSSGISQSNMIRTLFEDSQRIHKHLLYTK